MTHDYTHRSHAIADIWQQTRRSIDAYHADPFALTRALNDNDAAVLRMRALREKEKEA